MKDLLADADAAGEICLADVGVDTKFAATMFYDAARHAKEELPPDKKASECSFCGWDGGSCCEESAGQPCEVLAIWW
jgi:hypothetical protein